MLREGVAFGAINVTRPEPGPFTDHQISLLETFADQAVIAIENVRLFNETKESLERQTATSDVLQVISSSPNDLRPVFDAVLRNATTLCDAHLGILNLFDGEKFLTAAQRGGNPEFVKWLFERGAWSPEANSTVERMVAERKPVQVPDARETQSYRDGGPVTVNMVDVGGARTFLTVPLIKEGKVIGNIGIYRPEVRAFSERQVELVRTFADQAVIAIENVRMVNETKEALERQTATSDVLKAISRSTFDLGAVLKALLESASRLCGADRGLIFRPDGDGNYFPAVMFNYEPGSPLEVALRTSPLGHDRGSATGRAMIEKRTIHIPDVLADPEYKRHDLTGASNYRSTLAVPMLRGDELVGAITMTRSGEPRPFTDKQIELVTTFADQAVIAIQNVRLFDEIQEKSRQLEVAGKHKSEFLANMSHELSTPLNAIIGYSEMLQEEADDLGTDGLHPRPEEDQFGRQAPARAHQRRAGPLQDRGRQDGAVPRGLRCLRDARGHRRGDRAARGQERQRLRQALGQEPGQHARRSDQDPAGAVQPPEQRVQIHRPWHGRLERGALEPRGSASRAATGSPSRSPIRA